MFEMLAFGGMMHTSLNFSNDLVMLQHIWRDTNQHYSFSLSNALTALFVDHGYDLQIGLAA